MAALAELTSCSRDCGPQNLNYLLCGPFTKNNSRDSEGKWLQGCHVREGVKEVVVFELNLLSRRVGRGGRVSPHHGQTVFQALGTKAESWAACGLWNLEGHGRNKRKRGL